jgi:hypothetical protein
VDTWVQFGILLCAILGGIVQTDRRITRLEEDMKTEQKVVNYLGKRLDRLEEKIE